MTSETRHLLHSAALQHVAPAFRDALQKFNKRLDSLFGARLLNWTIFGFAATGEQPTPEHRAQHVLVLDRVDLDPLRQLAPEGLTFGPVGLAAPLIMTPAYVQTSLDAFPLEFIEIHQQHVTLLGEDLFGPLEFRDADVRLACEREVKALLLGMRQGLLSSGEDAVLLAAVERGATISLARLLAGLAWLKGERIYAAPADRLTQIENATGRSLTAARTSLVPRQRCEYRQFANFYDDLETLRKIIDAR